MRIYFSVLFWKKWLICKQSAVFICILLMTLCLNRKIQRIMLWTVIKVALSKPFFGVEWYRNRSKTTLASTCITVNFTNKSSEWASEWKETKRKRWRQRQIDGNVWSVNREINLSKCLRSAVDWNWRHENNNKIYVKIA